MEGWPQRLHFWTLVFWKFVNSENRLMKNFKGSRPIWKNISITSSNVLYKDFILTAKLSFPITSFCCIKSPVVDPSAVGTSVIHSPDFYHWNEASALERISAVHCPTDGSKYRPACFTTLRFPMTNFAMFCPDLINKPKQTKNQQKRFFLLFKMPIHTKNRFS